MYQLDLMQGNVAWEIFFPILLTVSAYFLAFYWVEGY